MHRTDALAAILVAAAALSACDGPPVYIVQHQIVARDSLTGACVPSINPAAPHRSSGVMDLTLTHTYSLQALFSAVNPRRGPYFIDGAGVELHLYNASGPPLAAGIPSFYQINAAATILPSDTGESFTTAALDIIPGVVGEALAARICTPDTTAVTPMCPVPRWPQTSLQIVVVVQPFGRGRDGSFFTGVAFEFPLTICCHCLVDFAASTTNLGLPLPNCDASPTAPVCNPGMDLPVPCTTCAGTNPSVCEPEGHVADGGVDATCPGHP